MGWSTDRYTEEQVRVAVASSRSINEALRKLGLRAAGHNYRTLGKLIARYAISTDHMDPNWVLRGRRQPKKIPPVERILVTGSHYNRQHLKHRRYEDGLKQRRCELCGQDEVWRGRAMSLILDHINGIATDNRLQNLRIVRPNCNATLDTHCGRQNRLDIRPRACLLCGREFTPKYPTHRYCSHTCGSHSKGSHEPKPETRKVLRPSYEQLMAELTATNFCAVARRYGVSDNAVRKWVAGTRPNTRGPPGRTPAIDARVTCGVTVQIPKIELRSKMGQPSNRMSRSLRIRP
jgi:DNA-binding transcriptional regulator YdaS (Cro superfamily)